MKLTRPVIIGIGVAAVVVLAIIGIFVFFPKGEPTSQLPIDSSQNVKKLTPEDIGLVMELSPSKKQITLKVTKLEGISSVEYELSYDAEETNEGETAVVQKGVVGSPIEVKAGDTEISRDLDLGTCSKNVCRYDKVKSDINVTLKVNFKDGSVGSVETKLAY